MGWAAVMVVPLHGGQSRKWLRLLRQQKRCGPLSGGWQRGGPAQGRCRCGGGRDWAAWRCGWAAAAGQLPKRRAGEVRGRGPGPWLLLLLEHAGGYMYFSFIWQGSAGDRAELLGNALTGWLMLQYPNMLLLMQCWETSRCKDSAGSHTPSTNKHQRVLRPSSQSSMSSHMSVHCTRHVHARPFRGLEHRGSTSFI